jgi:hypothetical protein
MSGDWEDLEAIGPESATVKLRNPITGEELLVFGRCLNVPVRWLGVDSYAVFDVEPLKPRDPREMEM